MQRGLRAKGRKQNQTQPLQWQVKKYRVYLEETTHGIAEVEAENALEAEIIARRRENADWSDDVDLLAYEIVEIDEKGEELGETRVYA